MPPKVIVYRNDTIDVTFDSGGTPMKFRLVYHGPIRPHNRGMDLLSHKHVIRAVFHRQLCEFWKKNDAFCNSTLSVKQFRSLPNMGFNMAEETKPLIELVRTEYSANCRGANGYEWVPLILKNYAVSCELDILLLFRGMKPGPLDNGDVDNRVKTVVDALRQPDPQTVQHLRPPRVNESPFFVLLQDDSIVSRLTVETDTLYSPRTSCSGKTDKDDRLAHAVITVTIRPFTGNLFNIFLA
jgi:hypothetical protein